MCLISSSTIFLAGLSGCKECVVRMGSSRSSFYHTGHNSAFSVKSVGLVTSMCRPIIRGFDWLKFGLGIFFPLNIFKGIIPCWECFVGEFVQRIFEEFC